MRKDRDVINAMSDSMSTLGMYIVLVFFAAQFVAFFNWTKLGAIIAVAGSDMLTSLGLTGPMIFVPFILLCGLINLSLGSASAQWAVTAPIFVPMLMLLGYAPETIQAAYRIGDSVTNLITPMMSYFGLIMAVGARYNKHLWYGYADCNHATLYADLLCWLDNLLYDLGIWLWLTSRPRRSNLLHAIRSYFALMQTKNAQLPLLCVFDPQPQSFRTFLLFIPFDYYIIARWSVGWIRDWLTRVYIILFCRKRLCL